jgi:site-specific DNA recombinase
VVNGKQEIADFLTGARRETDESEWLVTEKPELAVIDGDTFDKAQAIMASRGKAFRVDKERHSNQYLFSTLIKCRECGWSFRRVARTYKNTYVRWVCSGRNGKGADTCPNSVSLDEQELIGVLQDYFTELVQNKKRVTQNIVSEFTRIYKVKDENVNYEKELRDKLAKLEKLRSKYMDMYADDLITRQELNDKLGGARRTKFSGCKTS